MSFSIRKRFAAFGRLLRTAPDAEGIGAVRTLLLSVLVGLFAGGGAILLTSMLQVTTWLFLGKIAGVAMEGAAHEPEPFNLPAILGPVRPWLLLFLPAAGALLSGWFVNRFAPEAAGHGTDAAIESYHFRGGRVRPIAVPVKAIATSIVIGSGGSAGCEGPITQIGAGFGSMIANALGLSVASRRKLMAAGMGAGVGALFHAPLAGAIFAAELLYRDLDLEYEVLVPSIIASVTSYSLYSSVFGFSPLFETPQAIFHHPERLILYIALAFVLALGARFYTCCFYSMHERFSRSAIPVWLRPAVGGLATGLIGVFFMQALGSGYGTLQEALTFDYTYTVTRHPEWFWVLLGVFFLKTLTTAFSVGSGGSGGIFGPALVIGGSLGGCVGMLFATLLPGWFLPVGSFVLVGMVAFFGCAAKTPISTIIMIGEMTGNYNLLVPSMFVCIIAYLLSRKVSLYRSQLPNRFEAPVHRGSLISGTLGAFTVRDILNVQPKDREFLSVESTTPLSTLIDRLTASTQEVFPVIARDGTLTAIAARSDLSAALSADPVFRQTMLLDDLTLREHPVVFESEPLRSVLAKMDMDDAEAIVVASSTQPRKPIGIVTHNDIAQAYQQEMSANR